MVGQCAGRRRCVAAGCAPEQQATNSRHGERRQFSGQRHLSASSALTRHRKHARLRPHGGVVVVQQGDSKRREVAPRLHAGRRAAGACGWARGGVGGGRAAGRVSRADTALLASPPRCLLRATQPPNWQKSKNKLKKAHRRSCQVPQWPARPPPAAACSWRTRAAGRGTWSAACVREGGVALFCVLGWRGVPSRPAAGVWQAVYHSCCRQTDAGPLTRRRRGPWRPCCPRPAGTPAQRPPPGQPTRTGRRRRRRCCR